MRVFLLLLLGWPSVLVWAAPVDNTLKLPPGFQAEIVAENLGNARHLVVTERGDLYVALRAKEEGKGLIALRDTDGDHAADEIAYFGEFPTRSTGVALFEGYLYFTDEVTVYRQKLDAEALVPTAPVEVVVSGFPQQRSHSYKTIAIDPQGNLYVNVGAPSNVCQERDRTPKMPGQQPCPELEWQAGIWRFDARKLNQTQQADGHRYATGLRNCVAVEWDARTQALYALPHGRDQLAHYPEYFTDADNAELPAEEFHRLEDGGAYGWPYTYWDQRQGKRVVAPEYGGDGKVEAEAGLYADPLVAFPGHWAPNDLIFYQADAFPEKYRGGAFVAFHGSWNRAPYPQAGYNVAFVPYADGQFNSYEVFADNFGGTEEVLTPRNAEHRPCGLAVGPDGALYIADSQNGTIWRVTYVGEPAAE